MDKFVDQISFLIGAFFAVLLVVAMVLQKTRTTTRGWCGVNFKEFLDKQTIGDIQVPNEEGDLDGAVDDVVSVRALGEWAWEARREWLDRGAYIAPYLRKLGYKPWNEMGAMTTTLPNAHGRIDAFMEIAVACLGEAEVKKRLEVLK